MDEVGEETRGYDVLGNLARTTRTINPLRPGDRIRTFQTTFQFDVFGRMLSMVYPDGETLEYRYDEGGLLQSAQGRRPATAIRPRTGQPVPACPNCEATYGRKAFPDPATRFKTNEGRR